MRRSVPSATALAAPSYRPQLLGSRPSGISLLAALREAESAPASVAAPPDPIAALEQAAADKARQIALIAAEPQVQRDTAQFSWALAHARTPAGLLGNATALKVLLIANGLADQIGDLALATRALLSNPARGGAAVNQLADKRWLGVNKTYCFATKGLSVLHHAGAVEEIAAGYAEALWRMTLDRTTPGLSNALDFPLIAATISEEGQVLGDPTFRAVIATAPGVPRPTEPGARERAVMNGADLARFRDPDFGNPFAQRHWVAGQHPAARTASAQVADAGAGLVV